MFRDCQVAIVTIFQFISMDTPLLPCLGRIHPLGSNSYIITTVTVIRTHFALRREIISFCPLHSDRRSHLSLCV